MIEKVECCVTGIEKAVDSFLEDRGEHAVSILYSHDKKFIIAAKMGKHVAVSEPNKDVSIHDSVLGLMVMMKAKMEDFNLSPLSQDLLQELHTQLHKEEGDSIEAPDFLTGTIQ